MLITVGFLPIGELGSSKKGGIPKKNLSIAFNYIEFTFDNWRSMACRGLVGCGLPTPWSTLLLASPLLGDMCPDQKLDTHILGTVINPLIWICIPMTMIPIMEFQWMTIIYTYYSCIYICIYIYIGVYIYIHIRLFFE